MRVEPARRGRLAAAVALLFVVCACASATAPGAATPPAARDRPPPGGESCDEPIPLRLGEVLLGSTRDARDTLAPKCGTGAAPDRIYRFRVEMRSLFHVSLQADFDAVVALRESCSHEEAELACNDDVQRGQSQRSRLDASLEPGEYFLIVDGSRGATGDYELFAYLDPVESPEDACAAATPLPVGETVRGSTLGVPDRFQATCGHGAQAGEAVYRLELQAPSRLRVLQQSEYDGVLYLRSRCAVPTSELACNDDFRGPHRSLLTARLSPGTYFLFTDGLEKPQEGTFSLRAERGPLEPSGATGAELCEAARALPLEPGTAELDTFDEPGRQAGSCGGEGAPESVFALEVEVPSRLHARLGAPEFNAVLYLRGECEDPASEQACERQRRVDRRRRPGTPKPHTLDVQVAPGTHYLFVDGVAEEDFGAALLEVALTPVAELQQRCEVARVLADGDVVEGRLLEGVGHFGARCGGEARGPEHVYRLQLQRRAMVRLQLDSSFDAVLHVRQGCTALEGEVACNDDAGHSRRSGVAELLEAGTYEVFVDGFDPRDLGPYRLSVEISPAP